MQAPDKGLPAPDAVLFLDLPVQMAQARGGFGEERYETTELQNKVLSKFKELDDGTWHIIDASRTLDEVHKEVCTLCWHLPGCLCVSDPSSDATSVLPHPPSCFFPLLMN